MARESAACLLANAPCTPRRRRDVSACSRSIGPSWLLLDVRLGGKNVAGVVGSFKINNSVAGIRAPAQGKPLLMPLSPTRSSRAGYSRQATRCTAFTSRMMATGCAEAERRRPRSPGRHLLNQYTQPSEIADAVKVPPFKNELAARHDDRAHAYHLVDCLCSISVLDRRWCKSRLTCAELHASNTPRVTRTTFPALDGAHEGGACHAR